MAYSMLLAHYSRVLEEMQRRILLLHHESLDPTRESIAEEGFRRVYAVNSVRNKGVGVA